MIFLLFKCQKCGAEERIETEFCLAQEDIFVVETDWEHYPNGWIYKDKKLLCKECK